MPRGKKKKTEKHESLEQKLWKSADKLRKNIDAAEYKHIVLGLIFLKYISDAFEMLHEQLAAGEGEYEGADPEDPDEYKAENVFFVPAEARWPALQAQAKQPDIGQRVDAAMEAIELNNPKLLKGILPKVYGQQKLDPASLGGLIDMIGSAKLVKERSTPAQQLELDVEQNAQRLQQADVLGQVYEYFLGQFALAEGKKGGQFYTPESVVRVLVEMLEPYSGRVFDPCCGSGGMFVQSEKFVSHHQGRLDDISIYGQESNETTYKLCRMNLAIRGIDGSNIKWNPEGSFLNDAHKDLKADFVIANPPFNDSDWGGDLLRQDGRWQYGTPPVGNANFGWVQHFLYHLAPTGAAGFVLSNGSLSSNTGGEGAVRRALVESDLVDCIVMLPTQLFYNTGIPACLWFLDRSRQLLPSSNSSQGEEERSLEASRSLGERFGEGAKRNRKGEVLFIDASELGYMVNRRNRAFAEADIQKIAGTYHDWKRKPSQLPSSNSSQREEERNPKVSRSLGERESQNAASVPSSNSSQREENSEVPRPSGEGFRERAGYQDIKGFCKSATLADIEKHNFVLTPGRYVGIPDEEDDGVPFEEKMGALTAELAVQMKEAQELDKEIKIQLAKVGFDLEVEL
ncbi:MAG: SAM-dependent DNA methyltransferase [Spirulina sp. SIO3F2]|nr:SAM-dependent DNA methyltransferase [Spirulina sp. SIO3F2]